MPGRVSAMAGEARKRKKKQSGGGRKRPPLPPQVADDEIEISDEDVEFVRQHGEYAGFMANLDSASLSRQVLGLKPHEDVEAYYEKKSTRATEAQSAVSGPGEPLDDLPVKSLTGELHYRTATHGAAVDASTISIEERRALVRKGITVRVDEPPPTTEPHEGVGQDAGEAEKKKTKAELKKELKLARRKEREEKKLLAEQIEKEHGRPSIAQDELHELEEFVDVHKRRSDVRTTMAEIGTSVLADPENNLGRLKELHEMCQDRDGAISQLAMLSSMAIFKDLIPGYRIRLPTEKELEVVVSKEVKQLREFESTLLRYYQAYVQLLLKYVKSKDNRLTAVKCICALLEAVPHFNFRESLLKAVVPRLTSSDNEICNLCCGAITSIFKNFGKHGGEATVDAVQLIADLVKIRNCQLRPEAVQVFLALSFDEDAVRSSSMAAAGQPSSLKPGKKSKKELKKEKKVKKRELASKLRKEVKSDFKEAEVLPDINEYRAQQTLTLSGVFETYFRVLKTSSEPRLQRELSAEEERIGVKQLGPRPLLAASLEGLAKYAHLINVDFMGDLLDVLRMLASGGTEETDEFSDGTTNVWERMQCCIIAFKIVKNNLDALNIDLREFYVRFYNLLFQAVISSDDGKSGDILANAFQNILWEGRHTDMQRAAAFAKRLATVALHLEPAETMSALLTVQHLLVRYKKCRNILENDGGGSIGGGMAAYDPQGEDPDLGGALSTILWESSLQAQHYDPDVGSLATNISSLTDSNAGFLLTPVDAFRDFKFSTRVISSQESKPLRPQKKGQRYDTRPTSDFMSELIEQDTVPDVRFLKPARRFLTSHFKVMKALYS